MNWMIWKGLMPPAVVPLMISLAVALAGPGGLFGVTPDRTPISGSLVADVNASGHGGSPGNLPPGLTATPTPVFVTEETPAH